MLSKHFDKEEPVIHMHFEIIHIILLNKRGTEYIFSCPQIETSQSRFL